MRARSLVFVVLAATIAPVMAADHPRFKVFGAASFVSPLGEEDVDFGAVKDSVEASDEVGWNIGFEARFTTLLGLEIDFVNSTNDIEFAGETIAEVDMQPLSATLNFHLVPTGIVDFYIGPTATYFIYGDVEFETLGEVGTDDEFAYGASVGLEIGLGDHFAILGGVRWLKTDLTTDDEDEFAVDPLFSRLGVALRF